MTHRVGKLGLSTLVVPMLLAVLAVPAFAFGIQLSQARYSGDECVARATEQAVYFSEVPTFTSAALTQETSARIRPVLNGTLQKYLVCAYDAENDSILIAIGRTAVWASSDGVLFLPRSAQDSVLQ